VRGARISPRYGYRRLQVLGRGEGERVNHNASTVAGSQGHPPDVPVGFRVRFSHMSDHQPWKPTDPTWAFPLQQ
jgi:hypothetical protein